MASTGFHRFRRGHLQGASSSILPTDLPPDWGADRWPMPIIAPTVTGDNGGGGPPPPPGGAGGPQNSANRVGDSLRQPATNTSSVSGPATRSSISASLAAFGGDYVSEQFSRRVSAREPFMVFDALVIY